MNKIRVGESLFETKNKKHPGLTQFLNSGDYFIQCKIKNFNHKIMKNLNFTYPSKMKSIFLKRRLKTVVGFHTRNVPHRAHEWIHQYGLKKCNGLFIHPLIGQYKKKEYKEKIFMNAPIGIVERLGKKKLNKVDVLPLGGISNHINWMCNESDKNILYKADKYGFNKLVSKGL